MPNYDFANAISRQIWEEKYRYRDEQQIHDRQLSDTWQRVATALASVEAEPVLWQERFYRALEGFTFLPGGRIQAGAGTQRKVTLFNCFVMGSIEDSIDGIFDGLKQGALTMQQGGGVGYDFSTLRPRGTPAHSVGSIASGPVSFMDIWDSMCATLLSTGSRRGAMMATLRCDHPDIEAFVRAKADKSRLRHFNLSVLVSDAFMQAVADDQDWALLFPIEHTPATKSEETQECVMREWPGHGRPVACRVYRRIAARELWAQITRASYDYAEPGVLFIDRINDWNNQYYREHINATNPCGEIPLPPYGACDLGSINLTGFVQAPFSPQASIDMQRLAKTAAIATRMMDNVIDLSAFPLTQQAEQARGSRRIGLGITGLGDSLIMLGLHYGSPAARELAAEIMRTVCHAAYRCSIDLAKEKGAFPYLDHEQYLAAKFIQTLPDEIRDGIAEHGIRNSHLTAIAPTGTISLLAENISSGLEPVFDFSYQRRIQTQEGDYKNYHLEDYALRQWRQNHGESEPLPPYFVDAHRIDPEDHLAMQAAIQPYVDNAISKTINIPEDYDFVSYQRLYQLAYDKGLKGCTSYRPNPITGAILSKTTETGPHCCNIDREAD